MNMVAEKRDYRKINKFRKRMGLQPIELTLIPCLGVDCKKLLKSEGAHHRMCLTCKVKTNAVDEHENIYFHEVG